MKGPFHDFLLVDRREHDYGDYMELIRDPKAIRLGEDFIWYMNDALKWIPTINPAMHNEEMFGLCHWGVTAILPDGAKIAERIFNAWADLFAVGPAMLTLTGGWTVPPEWYGFPEEANYYHLALSLPYPWEVDVAQGLPEGECAELVLNRDECVGLLRKLVSWCREVAQSDGEKYILHQGI